MDEYGFEIDATENADHAAHQGAAIARDLADSGYGVNIRYQQHRTVAAYAVRPGDIVLLPHSGIIVEVYEVRLAVWVNPDKVAIPQTIFSLWRYDEHTGEERYNDNARQRRDGTMYVLGDQRDLIAFEHPSTRYMQRKIDIELTR